MKQILTLVALLGALALQAQNTFTYKTQNAEIILLSEGQRASNLNNLIGATEEIIAQTAPEKTYPGATNAFLIRTNGKNILADTGHGRELFKNLEQYGVTPEQIDAIILTHLHGDHIGGLVKEGKIMFPNAKLYLSEAEFKSANESALGILTQYSDKLILFEPGEESPVKVVDEIGAMKNYGHTPGHTVYFIDNLIIWGDMTHAMAIQMPYPKVAISYDTNPNIAIESRLKMLEYIIKHNLTAAGMHVPYPGIGTLKADGKGGYIFTPVK
ncbi:MAG: MBL fold metallo-hydrolase [Bacteroidales bacterium]|nr:MBL fold metallo-hydrolase [Bacteroidales bacterium]